MKQTYTKNHLLKYLYRETSLSETLAIEEALVEDRNLFEEVRHIANLNLCRSPPYLAST